MKKDFTQRQQELKVNLYYKFINNLNDLANKTYQENKNFHKTSEQIKSLEQNKNEHDLLDLDITIEIHRINKINGQIEFLDKIKPYIEAESQPDNQNFLIALKDDIMDLLPYFDIEKRQLKEIESVKKTKIRILKLCEKKLKEKLQKRDEKLESDNNKSLETMPKADLDNNETKETQIPKNLKILFDRLESMANLIEFYKKEDIDSASLKHKYYSYFETNYSSTKTDSLPSDEVL